VITESPFAIDNISYTYSGAERASVAEVSLDVFPGELHLLIGENGAGKSTLAKVIHGLLELQEGEIRLPASLYLPQHLLSYAETDFSEYLWLYFSWKNSQVPRWSRPTTRRRILAEALNKGLGREIDASILDEAVARVSTNILHLYVSILLLSRSDHRLFLLDEPTAVLSDAEARLLFQAISAATARGAAVIMITHRIGEALEHAHRISVMRRGRISGQGPAGNFPDAQSIHPLMFGQDLRENPDSALNTSAGPSEDGIPALFEIKYLSADFPDLCSLKDVSLSLKPGEILAVSGIRDEGLEQLERLFSGRISRFRGSAEFRGQPVDLAQPSALRKIGAGIVPSQRKRYGAALSAKAWENIGISMRDEDRQGFRRSPMSPRRRFKDRVLRRYEGLELNLDVPASSYSGGMLQQLIVNREISIGKELLILSNPGWGLDPQHRERIYELIRSSAAGGAAVLLISSELDEALELGHRLACISDGRLFYPADSVRASRTAIESVFLGQWEGVEHA
jgi:ABC-type uncharacterized transport system ATPase subunit